MKGDYLPGDPHCPACGKLLDGFTDVKFEGAVPSPGDASVCAYCAAMLTFDIGPDGNLIMRYPTDEELAKYVVDPGMIKARDTVMQFIRITGGQ